MTRLLVLSPVRQGLAQGHLGTRQRCNWMPPIPPRTPGPGGVRRCGDPPPARFDRRSRRTDGRRRDAPGASPDPASPPTRVRDRRTGCIDSLRGAAPCTPATAGNKVTPWRFRSRWTTTQFGVDRATAATAATLRRPCCGRSAGRSGRRPTSDEECREFSAWITVPLASLTAFG